jgi:hypothetical protein
MAMAANYKQRYDRVKTQVDIQMGRPLGRWGRFKAFFRPNSLSEGRKAAIAEAENRLDTLYQPHNVIGTTSAKGQRPTVYYRTASGTFGHITQEHGMADNIGREIADKHPHYTYGNEINKRGKEVLVERINGRSIHTSRNALKPINTKKQREAAATAHLNFPHLKHRYQG